jgi:hypothetical protein
MVSARVRAQLTYLTLIVALNAALAAADPAPLCLQPMEVTQKDAGARESGGHSRLLRRALVHHKMCGLPLWCPLLEPAIKCYRFV